MKSLMFAAAVASALLGAGTALASPSPSPPLDTLLATPPGSGYVSDSSTIPQVDGRFDAVDFLFILGPPKPSKTLATLKDDGFVQGYGRTWVDRSARHFLVETVVAFGGGAGAGRWLPEARALNQRHPYFDHEISVSGIGLDMVFGSHFAYPAGPQYADVVGFVKGNDFFYLYLFSEKDDLGDTAARQAKEQYDSAPANTIPESQWPESTSNRKSFNVPPSWIVVIIPVVSVIVLAGLGLVALLLIRGMGRLEPGAAYAAGPGGVQMSPDGYYWWDGQAWRPTVPPAPPAS